MILKGFAGLLAGGCLVIALTGCSVGMAMSGKEEPNLGAFRVGSPRGEVELQLGSPISAVTNPDGGRTDIYEYELGNKPSAGRAAGHAVLDVLTLGIWEVVGTPIEAFQGDMRRLAITYDAQDRVRAINQATVPAGVSGEPSDRPPAMPVQSASPTTPPVDSQLERLTQNNKNLLRLQVDMTQAEVHGVMGDPDGSEGHAWGTVWLYQVASPSQAGDSTLTPVVFDETGTLKGWGRTFLASYHGR